MLVRTMSRRGIGFLCIMMKLVYALWVNNHLFIEVWCEIPPDLPIVPKLNNNWLRPKVHEAILDNVLTNDYASN